LTLQGHTTWVRKIVFSPDGRRLASISGGEGEIGELKLWDAETGEELLTFDKVGSRGVAFSPDGHRLVSAGPEGLKIYDATPLPEKP
jgi:WD40 repeat protein